MSGTGESSAFEEDALVTVIESTDGQSGQALVTSLGTRSSASVGISEPASSVLSGNTDDVATLDRGELETCAPQSGRRVRPVIRNKNWDKDEIAALVTAWRSVALGEKEKGESMQATNSRLYKKFIELVGEGQSEKAVLDKKDSLWTSYRFIVDFNNNLKIGSTGRPNWFELSRKEKREIKTANKVDSRVTDMAPENFQALDTLFGYDHAARPASIFSSGPVQEADDSEFDSSSGSCFVGSFAPTSDTGSSAFREESDSLDGSTTVRGKRKRRSLEDTTWMRTYLEDHTRQMQSMMKDLREKMDNDREQMRREFQRDRDEERTEREKDRDLLRELFMPR